MAENKISYEVLIERLNIEPLYEKIKDDSEIFLAIKEGCINFYHMGKRLFSYDKDGFKTNIKYAAVIEAEKEKKTEYVTEEQLQKCHIIKEFSKHIKEIKDNCKHYSRKEENGVATICKKHSYRDPKKNIVVLDIEIAFDENESGSGRIDILLYNKETRSLHFVEAKHTSNPELKGEPKPEVINQIDKYERQIKNKDWSEKILKKYGQNIKFLNKLFGNILPENPQEIDKNVTLLVFGYKQPDEKKYKALGTKIRKDHGKKVRTCGNAKNIEDLKDL
jgi:hypothetical protein